MRAGNPTTRYFIYGCDNYVNTDYMNLLLDDFDHTKPLWIAQYALNERMPKWVKLSKHPKAANKKQF